MAHLRHCPPVYNRETSCARSATTFDCTRLDKQVIPGGPIAASYENYVKSIFHPNKARVGIAGVPPGGGRINAKHFSVEVGNVKQKINASTMLKMEEHLGKDALSDELDDKLLLNSPLDSIYEELGVVGGTTTSGPYQVYSPKSTGEYFSVMQSVPAHAERHTPVGLSRTYTVAKQGLGLEGEDERPPAHEWKRTTRQLLVDYKDFESAPLSPYMYRNHPYVQCQDSRIVGSNFVQLTTRPRDAFLDKIDKTLADIRSSPRTL